MWILFSLAALGLSEDAQPSMQLGKVQGSTLKLEGSQILVGLKDGGVASYDSFNKKLLFHIPGDNIAPVKDVILFGNRPWWIVEGGRFVRTGHSEMKVPMEIDLSSSGISGPIRRISAWQDYIVAHADDGFRFIDPQTQRVLTAYEVLPPEVASIAVQGIVTTQWKGGKGLLVSIRKYADKVNPKPGEVDEIGMLTAWSAEWRGQYTLLGSYACDLVDFQNQPVTMTGSGPNAFAESTVSAGPVGNIMLGPEGIVALDYDEALTIPLYKDNWITGRIKTKLAPRYAQSVSYNQSDLWWSEDGRLIHASLEDGSTDVFLPRFKGKLLNVAADEDGAWVLFDGGVRRIDQSDDAGPGSFVHYEVGSDAERPGIGGQARLAWVLKSAKKPGGKKIVAKTPMAFVMAVLKQAGIPTKRTANLEKRPGAPVDELQYGDVIVEGQKAAFYLGNGKMLSLRSNGLLTQSLELTPESRIHRFFMSTPRMAPGVYSLPIADIGPVFLIGVGKPNPRLGHDLYVRIQPGSPTDGPHLPSHHHLLSIAEDWVGTPYRWGGQTMDGTDCSGFVMSVFSELGINLPRHSQWMARAPFGEVVFDELRFGDVLVFPNPKHVAIYIGDGRTVETTQGAVGYSNVYRRRVAYVRRFLFG